MHRRVSTVRPCAYCQSFSLTGTFKLAYGSCAFALWPLGSGEAKNAFRLVSAAAHATA
jgi:hypothetical protein